MQNHIERARAADPAITTLINSGNELHIKASEQEGILASALIAAGGMGIGRAIPPGVAELACLLATVGLAVAAYIGLGAWKIGTAKRWMFQGSAPRARTIWLPTIALIVQTLAFLGGLGLFLFRIAQ